MKTFRPLGGLLIPAMAAPMLLAMVACGSEQTLEFKPQIEVTIKGNNKTTHQFFPDNTGGQITDDALVLVRNSGKGDLELSGIVWQSANVFMTLVYPKGKPPFPHVLKENGILRLRIDFKPDPNIEDNRGGRLSISHNDQDKGANPVVLNFTIIETGCKIVLDTTEYAFINPSKHNPPEACFTFGNEGTGECVFKNAYMGTATPYYAVTKIPNQGEKIGAFGSNTNPKNNPKKLQVCVRLKPEGPDKDYQSSLIIETSDKSNPKRRIDLDVNWQKTNVFKWTSDDPKGYLIYDYTGVTGGTTSRCLNVYNEGPAGYLVNTVEVKAYNVKEQTAAEAQYKVELYKFNTVTGNKDKVKATPWSVNAAKSLDVCIVFTHPTDGSEPVKGRVLITYSQANIPDKVEFPIVAGKCDTPQAVFAPAKTPLWLMAAVGKTTKGTMLIANQSCAPLTIIKACVTQTTSTGAKDICALANIASGHFKVATNVGLVEIKPWSIMPIELEFSPPNQKFKNVHHLLNVMYCAGSFAGNQCKGAGVVTRSINVTGHVSSDTKTPTLKLALAVGSEAIVGAPVKIDAIAKAGAFPISEYGAYLWLLRKRPAGSKVWLTGEFQVSDEAWITLKPDVPGEYELLAAVQSVDTQTNSNLAWSEQVSITITAKKTAKKSDGKK